MGSMCSIEGRVMIVTLRGLPDGKDLTYETGFNYFVDTVRLRIAEYGPPDVTPSLGAMPVDVMPTQREVVFYFSRNIGGHCIYASTIPESPVPSPALRPLLRNI